MGETSDTGFGVVRVARLDLDDPVGAVVAVLEHVRSEFLGIGFHERLDRVRSCGWVGVAFNGRRKPSHWETQVTYYIYKDRTGEWRWFLMTSNARKIADSGEGYKNRSDCLAAIRLVQSSARANVIEI